MRKIVCFVASIVLATSTALLAHTMLQDDNETRAQADTLYNDNNYAEALQLYQKLALDAKTTGNVVPVALSRSVECLTRLNRVDEFDDFFEQVVAAHSGNWMLLTRAATVLATEVPHEGFLIAGQFERGHHRGGGKFVTAAARDRVRAIQLLRQAIALLDDSDATPEEKAIVCKRLADVVGSIRFEGAWKLQDLTDLKTLPDYEESQQWGWRGMGGSDNKGAPVDADGNPVFHQLPESWETAKSDGERWRWALAQVVRADEKRRSEIDLVWAGFLQSQFGVSTTAIGPTPVVKINEAEDTPRDATPWNAHELPDTETTARLATGVKRFALPDEFNHVVIYRNVVDRSDNQLRPALEALVGVRMNRHQYAQAVELLKRILELAANDNDRNNVQQRIDQIEGHWVQFESTKVQPAGEGATLDIRFRNGNKVTFTARPVNIDQLLADTKAYLQSAPDQLDHQKLQIENVGYRLIQDDREKYLGESVADWTLELEPPANHFDALQTVTTPLQKAGAYWITATMADGNETRIVAWVADTAITRKRVEGGTMYFVADAVSGKPVARANLEFFGYRQENVGGPRQRRWVVRTSRFADRTDNDGLAIPSTGFLNTQYQWLVVARTQDGRMAYDGFQGVWNPQQLGELNYSPTKVYAVTDRPVYRPEHTVKFRLWVRQPRFHEDDTEFADQAFTIEIRNPKGDAVFTKDVVTDRWAGADGEWTIPADATLGQFSVSIGHKVIETRVRERNGLTEEYQVETIQPLGQGTFRVEEYRKPEFEVTVDAPDKPVKLGDEIQAKITARYYFGAPVAEATVHYKVERTKKDQRWYPVGRWDWLYSPGYWWFSPNYEWYPGWSRWGCWAPIPPWWGWNPDPPEVVAEGDAEIGPDGTYLISIDTAAALREHSDSDHNYNITAEVVDQSRRTIIGTGSVIVARDPFKVFVWTDRGHYQTGDTANVGIQARTPDGKGVNGTGTATLFSIAYEPGSNMPKETEVESWDITTDDTGNASLKMTVPDSGQFRISVKVTASEPTALAAGPGSATSTSQHPTLTRTTDKDVQAQLEGGYVFFVRGPNEDGSGYRFNALELITEKREYQPGEKVSLQINTNKADSTVLLFVRPMNRLVPKPQILRLDGKSTTFDLTIERRDMPNIFVEALTITDGKLHSEMREIVVPPEERVANVEVLPSAERYRPGEEAKVKLRLTNLEGKPFVGNTVLSVYDASLEYIAASSIPEIRSFFWNVRRYHSVHNEATLDDVSQPLHLPDQIAMQQLHGSDPGMSGGGMFGYGVHGGGFGGRGRMMPAMLNAVTAVAGGSSAAEVQPAVRSQFADTAYWVASVTSNSEGIVEASFKVPDNLTTWKVKAWTLGDGTRVGQGSSDIISSKDLIIRPQTPRFFTETDRITLSAVVHNYLTSAKSARVVLETEGGQLELLGDAERIVQIPADGEARVDWNVHVVASGTTTVRMKALTDEESDATELTVPVNVHGILKTESFTGVIRPDGDSATVNINVPAARIEEQSRLEIRYSPSLASAMVDSLPYLIDYPYGCTEQTLNRFLPAVITQRTLQKMGVNLADVKAKRTNLNAQELSNTADRAAQWKRYDRNPVFDETEMNVIIADGVKALTEMQLSDGGWGWFSGFGEHSTAHLTSQVVHGLTIAQKNDVAILPDVIQRGVVWLKNYQATELEKLREGDWRREHPDELKDRHKPYKNKADNMDAFVAFVLTEHDGSDPAMSDYLYRDRVDLSVYGMALTGLVLHSEAVPSPLEGERAGGA